MSPKEELQVYNSEKIQKKNILESVRKSDAEKGAGAAVRKPRAARFDTKTGKPGGPLGPIYPHVACWRTERV